MASIRVAFKVHLVAERRFPNAAHDYLGIIRLDFERDLFNSLFKERQPKRWFRTWSYRPATYGVSEPISKTIFPIRYMRSIRADLETYLFDELHEDYPSPFGNPSFWWATWGASELISKSFFLIHYMRSIRTCFKSDLFGSLHEMDKRWFWTRSLQRAHEVAERWFRTWSFWSATGGVSDMISKSIFSTRYMRSIRAAFDRDLSDPLHKEYESRFRSLFPRPTTWGESGVILKSIFSKHYIRSVGADFEVHIFQSGHDFYPSWF
jgi:hypothetical protein